LEFVENFMNCLDDATFSGKDKLLIIGNGVNYHVVSVFLDELTPFLPVNLCVLEVLFRPFFYAMVKLNDKVLLGKIRSCFFDVLLMNGKRLLEVKKNGDEDCNGDVVNLGTVAIVMLFSSKLFELASGSNCVEGNRKVLFEFHCEFLKLERDAVNSGFKFFVSDSVDWGAKDLPPIVEVDGLSKKGFFDKVKKAKNNKNKKSENCEMNCADKNVANENGGNSNDEEVVDGEGKMVLNESMLSNLEKQFENVAGDGDLDDGVASEATGIVSYKRKRTKNSEGKTSQDYDLNGGDAEFSAVAKSGEKSSKKVKFSMESNLVWTPHSPLPPESLRIPPSVTPRGSALKKGVPPGPISDMPLPLRTKRAKLKARNKIRLMKLKSLSV
jgi:ribosomal RNA-processing protein 1